ncbi:hypothetical protein Daura_10320 [Dactylosporangium aurantiacum]|uniref:Thrombospondin n=1 Tax=Dactylosporangium aurantiacum TaxID=35754 RepID=A0A9Q9MJ35_9ACTN|nr:hypothetical protein [Dactylosporangium aurantiacum]MDG6108965.1 hypothetical protein [Dactylosporangium aurantiacum]UWZ56530.1 hypothetical protein Daura_10320 [Dactylosporangium aurantiacum]
MGRIGQLFGGRNAGVVDRDHDGVDDRAEDRTLDTRDRTLDTGDRTLDMDDRTLDQRDATVERRHDKDGDGIDDRVEAKRLRTSGRSTDRTHRIPAVGPLPGDTDTDRDGIADRRETHTTTMKPVIDREQVTPVTDADADVVPVDAGRPARASLLSTLGLVVGVAAVAAALTGLLAVWALPLGALGLLLSFGGIIAGARRHVAGRGTGTLGVLLSGTAVIFAILAITGQVSWLDTDVDQVARLNSWLDAQFPWMRDW